MMNLLNQIFTRQFRGDFTNSLKLIFLSEGYLSSEEQTFYNDVMAFVNSLGKYYPISLTNNKTSQLSFFWKFLPSANHGTFLSTSGSPGRTVFESFFNTGSQQLNLNPSLVDSQLNNLAILKNGNAELINNAFNNGGDNSKPVIVIILLPTATNNNIETELIDPTHYSAIVTSMDGYYEQTVVNAIGKFLGLGNEYELEGSVNLSPTSDQADNINSIYPNLLAFPNPISTGPNPSTNTDFSWRNFFNKNYNQSVPLHPHPGSVNDPDRSIPTIALTYKNIELWEGGGGFRTQVYRSAFDCIMRRRIGDTTLSIKNKALSLCPVCMSYMERYFG